MRWRPLPPSESRAPESIEGAPAPGSHRAKAVAAGGAGLMLVALTLNVVVLLVCGASFVVVALLAACWVRVGVKGAQVRRRLLEHHVVEGELLEAVIELRGVTARLAGAAVADELSCTLIPSGGAGWRRGTGGAREHRALTVAGRRGRHSFAAPTLVVEDPLGLARATLAGLGGDDQVLVLPRTGKVVWSARGRRVTAGEQAVGQAVLGSGEIDGLREYRPGAPAARIHWPALARGAGLLERRLVSAADARPLVVLDARGEASVEGRERLDAAVRAAASLVLELARRGGCSVLIGHRRVPTFVGPDQRAWPAVHAQLALVEIERHHWRAPALRPENARGPLLYVSSGAVALPASARLVPYPVTEVLPLVAAGGRGAPVLEVAGCGGYTIIRRAATRAA